ncbi:MAG: TetR/AcrR family transcriptional regulator [Clostridiales bacterium]|jgi:AcrR family transcriptional regulator|nr:TetR/AcrR family transcriptional regulator [Clostridiales bacterium]
MARITKPVEERRQEIINTARKLFTENGFDKTTAAEISKAMNVADGLIFHYFKSKTDILYAVIDELAAEQTEKVKRILDDYSGSAFEGLKLVFNSQKDYETHSKLIASLKSDQAIIEYCIKKMTSSAMPLLFSLIERGNADNSWNCKYPKETVAFILQGFSGLIEFHESSTDEEHKILAFTDILFRILGVGY